MCLYLIKHAKKKNGCPNTYIYIFIYIYIGLHVNADICALIKQATSPH